MTPRILFLDHVGVMGGAELALLDITRPYRGNCLVVLFEDGPFRGALEAQGVRVQVLSSGRALQSIRRESTWPGLRAIGEVLRLSHRIARLSRNFDLVYAGSQKAFVAAAIASQFTRRPLLWDLNDIMTPAHFSRANIRIAVMLANRTARCVVANSQATADAFISQGGTKARVRVVHNGIDAGPFDAVTEREVAETRHALGLNGAATVAVFGRLAPWKGQHIALEALRALPGVHLLLVGAPLFGESEYLAALRVQADRDGIADRVAFLGFRPDIPRLMRACDVVLHTSTAPEPFGRVVVEGMLARRPVVATRDGGVAEIIRDGVTGLLVPSGDAGSLVVAVRRLLEDRAFAEQMGEAAYSDATERFGAEAMVSSVGKCIDEAIGR